MGRGVSAGGSQSSLSYLFGSGEPANNSQTTRNQEKAPTNEPASKLAVVSQPVDKTENVPARIHSSNINNYFCADGQNCGNFLIGIRPRLMEDAPPKVKHKCDQSKRRFKSYANDSSSCQSLLFITIFWRWLAIRNWSCT
ncbi:hypothetical protein HAX54_004201 [Datura stramonium]|uniref:Uncharacterized protein n=1 Tax=Datura stramonium TaxID=4076 RepID=A0ABS8T7U1_DATST|nr:hypothetical protein [Datura stramonium]